MRLLLIDNYDSFTYNLVQLFLNCTAGASAVDVVRNDQPISIEDMVASYSGLIISPGPGGPQDSGISADLVQAALGNIPILGVCLGHQLLAWLHGAHIVQAPLPMHGKTSVINHSGRGVLMNLPSPFKAMRYHSLHVPKEQVPSCFRIDAVSDDDIVMALSHKSADAFGVQFHPESFLSEHGATIALNFLKVCHERAC